MLRINSANNTNVLPAPLADVSPPGFFANNPGAGPGTVLSGDWANRVQEEIIGPILAARIALDGADNSQLLKALRRMFAVNGQCQLSVSSVVQLLLLPRGGNILRINGTAYGVPTAGLAVATTDVEVGGVAHQNLAASTDYLLFMKDDGSNTGLMAPSFWPLAGGHKTDDTLAANLGVEVRNNGGAADSTRSLVGLVCTDAAAHFTVMLTRSWFNRGTSNAAVQASGSTASAAQVEVSAGMRVPFACFADELVILVASGYSNVSGGTTTLAQVTYDGIIPGSGAQLVAQPTASAFSAVPYTSVFAGAVGEGRHFATLLGNVIGGGTGTFQNATHVAIR